MPFPHQQPPRDSVRYPAWRIAELLDRDDWDRAERERFRLRLQFANTTEDQESLLGEIETAVMAMVVEAEHAVGVANAYGMEEET